MKKRLVVANWKQYVEKPEAALAFVKGLKRRLSGANAKKFSSVDIAIAPPFPFIPLLSAACKSSSVRIGAQTLSVHGSGAHTGEVSAEMIKRSGGSFSLIGHSERRAAGESFQMVREELRNAVAADLRAVLCIGEKERDQHGGHFSTLSEELASALSGLPAPAAARLVVAYEPIWAIGKTAAQAMPAADVRETVIFIRKTLADLFERSAALRVPILYGGSVEPENAATLMREGEVSGFLVGHASADLDSFTEILNAVRSDPR